MPSSNLPKMPAIADHLLYPIDFFADDFKANFDLGESVWRDSEVAFVGLARNCDSHLEQNLARLAQLAGGCRRWSLHVETNDNIDNTEQVLVNFCRAFPQATFTSQRLGRRQFSAEFAGPRTQALAEYRTACQRWIRENAGPIDYVVVIDFDAWGGWSHAGFLHGVGALQMTADAYGMASVSLIQHPQMAMGEDKQPKIVNGWLQYDAWALRLNSAFDDYTAGMGGWKHSWLPPVGSPPVPVVSAFGGMAIYDSFAFLKGTYDGSDCEHVTFHKTIAERTGSRLYLDPAMRTVMHWLEQSDGGQHGSN
jgi:hypothetical protein